jgi:hypothetical protein
MLFLNGGATEFLHWLIELMVLAYDVINTM